VKSESDWWRCEGRDLDFFGHFGPQLGNIQTAEP
jgi:hypothetical protein